MWIKSCGTLYNTDNINSMAIRTKEDGDFIIELEEHEAHFYELGGMTKDEARVAFDMICDALSRNEGYLDIDTITLKDIRAWKIKNGYREEE